MLKLSPVILTMVTIAILSEDGCKIDIRTLDNETRSTIKEELKVCKKSTFGNFINESFKVYKYKKNTFYIILPVYYVLNRLKIPIKVDYIRPSVKISHMKDSNVMLRNDMQKQCFDSVTSIVRNSQYGGGIINATTGFGKTALSIKIISYLKLKTLVVVNRVEIMNQWITEFGRFMKDEQIGVIKGKRMDSNSNICIGMLQTISLKETITCLDLSSFDLLIVDEVHLLSCSKFSELLYKVNARYRFGLTATLERKDELEKVIIWHLGDIVYSNVKDSQSKKQKSTIDIIYYESEMKEILLRDNQTPNVSKMLSNISMNSGRNTMIIDIILGLCKDKLRNILVVSDRIDQLKYINSILLQKQEDIKSGLFIGSIKREELMKNKEECQVLLATYSMVNEGFNCPRLNCLMMATPRSNITQCLGRIYRKVHSDVDPIIIDIVDMFSIFQYQVRKRKKIYNDEIASPIISSINK